MGLVVLPLVNFPHTVSNNEVAKVWRSHAFNNLAVLAATDEPDWKCFVHGVITHRRAGLRVYR